MFKFRSYNVKKATENDEKKQTASASKTPSYSAMTLRKPPKKEKKKASTNEIKAVSNKESPEYRRNTSVSASASATASSSTSTKKWTHNKTFVPKKEKEQEKKINEGLNLHKKLIRQ